MMASLIEKKLMAKIRTESSFDIDKFDFDGCSLMELSLIERQGKFDTVHFE